ncbi:hypothetical protein C8R45DRAFT_1172027 [Mycena sanguinolenta]|nr:hypothetical protein C8R45DRAFT_1172027 [Mycena sanguinolenta]
MAEPRLKESDAPIEQKVKVEQPTLSSTPGLKVEKVESECSTTPEIAVLKALLKKKEDQALAREIASETKLLSLDKENKRLKQKQEVDLARIESLEAEVARLQNPHLKREDPPRIGSPNKSHAPEEGYRTMVTLDSEDEETEDDQLGAPDMAEVQPSLEATPKSPGPTHPQSNGRPSRDAWSPLPDTTQDPLHNRDPDSSVQPKVEVKEEVIDVVIKKEGEADQFKRVTLIKSEDGNFDIWKVDGFHLGPTVEVDEKYNRGFTRKVISDAFGGGHVVCYHHWYPKPAGKPTKTPFATFNRSWNNALPTSPGLHGMVFANVRTCRLAPQPVNFFVGEGTNNWRLSGTYDYLRYGHIAPHHISLLPPGVLNNWVDGMLNEAWIKRVNAGLEAGQKIPFTRAGIVEALKDGRVEIPFTILKCVGYPEDWFEKLLYYEKHPKPKKSKESKAKLGKRPGRGQAKGSPQKRAKGSGKVKLEETPEPLLEDGDSESNRESDGESDDDDDEYPDGGRQIATLPTRKSPRKMQLQRSQSVEL